ncbi:MAG: M20/M25/M40 family metallo-hydrolase [Xanthomonadaceae bacterium]|nr:M20/M25/M40 family metallo-hydrolase [Xanthomonadaceae bacterium]
MPLRVLRLGTLVFVLALLGVSSMRPALGRPGDERARPNAAVDMRIAAEDAAMLGNDTRDATAYLATSWYRDIQAMADAKHNDGRRAYLRERLSADGFSVESMPFKTRYGKGENLLVPVGGVPEASLLLIGAHTDRTRRGRGAADNGSGVAIAIALAQRLRASPLRRHRVALALWDMEEPGLFGAKAYITERRERPALYVNLDVLAWGDTLWMMTPDPALALVESSRIAATAQGFAFRAEKRHPASDHLAFYDVDWPAVSYMLTDGSEIPSVLRAMAGEKVSFVPKLTATIHSHRDTLDKVEPAIVARAIDALEAALRDWDANAAD